MSPPSTKAGDHSRRESRVSEMAGVVVGDRYRILELLAEGGMGEIYRAVQHPLGREVALKVLSPRLMGNSRDPSGPKRFLREASTLARLAHANTVTLYDAGEAEIRGHKTLYMAMELVDGQPLHQVLAESGPMSVGRAVNIVYEVCRALREAHAAGIVHRDLKPSNIMVVPRGGGEGVKVLDFGIAKLISEELEPLTLDNRVVGSPRYMAPEQILQEPVDGRTDIYSLGVVLFELLTGRAPFSGRGAAQTMVSHVRQRVPPMSTVTERRIPATAEAIVRRCLAKRPSRRFPDVSALMEELRRTEWGSDIDQTDAELEFSLELEVAPTEELSAPRAKPGLLAPGRRFAGIAGAALLFGAGLGGLGWWVAEPTNNSLGASNNGITAIQGSTAKAGVPVQEENTRRMERGAPHGDSAVASPMVTSPVSDGAVSGDGQAVDEPVRSQVQIVSVPPGASVWEGEARLGTTPLSLPMTAVGSGKRTLELRKEGFLTRSVVWHPESDEELPSIVLTEASTAGP